MPLDRTPLTEPSDWLPFPIQTRDDVPEGWVFIDRGDGILEPFMAFEPDEDEG